MKLSLLKAQKQHLKYTAFPSINCISSKIIKAIWSAGLTRALGQLVEPAQLRIRGSASGMTSAVGKYARHQALEGGGKKKRKLERAWRGRSKQMSQQASPEHHLTFAGL